jgi:adenosine deaminase
MRGFVPSEGLTGHDHFFDAFAKFGGTDPRHTGAWVDEVAARAASQNILYLELMVTPTWHRLNAITEDMTWREDLRSLKDELVAKGLFDDIAAGRAFLDEADALRRERGHCGTPDASPACQVETRYIYEVFRNTPKESVLAQAIFGFELASVDPRVAGINLVGGEDDYAAMADYADHMRIFEFVHGLYPKVHLSMHAGACAGARAAGGALLSCAPGGGGCRHRPHRSRRGRDV